MGLLEIIEFLASLFTTVPTEDDIDEAIDGMRRAKKSKSPIRFIAWFVLIALAFLTTIAALICLVMFLATP